MRPTFQPTLVFSMLNEMLDAFDQGFLRCQNAFPSFFLKQPLILSLTCVFLGSKMVPIFSWIQMGKDLLLIRLRYVINAWKIAEGPVDVIELR